MAPEPAAAEVEMVGASMTFEILQGRRPRRRASSVTALRDVSFAVPVGTLTGCVGPPGAGKSTLVRIAAGLLAPTSGYVRTAGLLPVREAATLAGRLGAVVPLAGRVGAVLPGRHGLWPDLSVATALATVAAIRRLPAGRWQLRVDDLVERLDLTGALHRPLGALDPSRQVRAEVAAALLHEPPVLLLDGVLAGLGATGRARVGRLLQAERRRERTILLTGRSVGDVAELAQRILVLDAGVLAFEGTLPQLAERADSQPILVVDLAEPGRPLDDVSGTDLLEVEAGGLRQRLGLRPGVRPERVLAEVTGRAGVRDVSLLEPQLGDVLARLRR